MSSFTAVDLSRLPAPSAVEEIDFEVLFAKVLAQLRTLDPTFDALVESDPAYKILQLATYREMLLRQEINDKIRSVLLATAAGSMLDHLGAFYGVARIEIEPGDNSQGIAATMESDDDFRRRIQMAPEGFSVAGPEGAYISHGLAADARVLDVAATSPQPGYVSVYVLSREGNGAASEDLIASVAAVLNAEDVRPLTDNVTVLSAAIVEYEIRAELVIYSGPDAGVVSTAAQQAAQAYADDNSRLGQAVSLSAVYKALHQEGVARVNLQQPAANLDILEGEASRCTGIHLTVVSIDDA
ncbi:baseplate J/gp47 family protein [Stenotrophomonas sp. MMGLT7]|uniref:baseplate assembly protein n=1 Tax=Stenotrophomonas sp. MMGLT7 TaxID=2901227 RepID=UPI001E58F92E|nr:baseplate J/gp47 family protein [Stenotrophomonas sp. MMGLT7]MCD7096986.1 baseplate J/gp47 family protein [Stenotrophomonas sp. MMGLT7]